MLSDVAPPNAINSAMKTKYPNESFKNADVSKALSAFVPDKNNCTFSHDNEQYIIIRHVKSIQKWDAREPASVLFTGYNLLHTKQTKHCDECYKVAVDL